MFLFSNGHNHHFEHHHQDEVIVTAPQPSVAEAEPSEPSGFSGLQPRFTSP
jgi:hypothetical protein